MNETVSLVGRTNVGKSSLFNKLIKSKSAIVSNHEGLTRDIKVAELQYFNKAVNLVDTGGFFTSKDDDFEDLIIAKAYEAIEQSDKVIFGSTVTLIDVNDDSSVTYCIVGDDESDIKKNLISVNSPIARGLIGKLEGDEVSINTPGGLKEFEIDKVDYI